MKTMIVSALLMAFSTTAEAIELEFQAKGEPVQLLNLQMNRKAQFVKIKKVSNTAPMCRANDLDKANRCQEADAKSPIQPQVSLLLKGLIGDVALIGVTEMICDAREVVTGPLHPTTGAAQFLLMPADCHGFNRLVKVQLGEPLALDSEEGQQFLGRYTVKLLSTLNEN